MVDEIFFRKTGEVITARYILKTSMVPEIFRKKIIKKSEYHLNITSK